jgi:hypothetical protein
MALQSQAWLRLMGGKHFGFSDYQLTTAKKRSMRSLSTSPQAGSAFNCCTPGLRVGFTNPNSCSDLCFRRCFSLVLAIRAGWHSSRGSSNDSDTAAFVFWPCTAQSVERSTILARPSTRLSSDKRCCLVVQKTNKADRDLQGLLLNQIRQEYANTPKVRLSR